MRSLGGRIGGGWGGGGALRCVGAEIEAAESSAGAAEAGAGEEAVSLSGSSRMGLPSAVLE